MKFIGVWSIPELQNILFTPGKRNRSCEPPLNYQQSCVLKLPTARLFINQHDAAGNAVQRQLQNALHCLNIVAKMSLLGLELATFRRNTSVAITRLGTGTLSVAHKQQNGI